MDFEAVEPIEDPCGDFFSRRQQPGESLHSFYLALVRLAAKVFPIGKHKEEIFSRLLAGITDIHLRRNFSILPPKSAHDALMRAKHVTEPTEQSTHPNPFPPGPTWQGPILPPPPPPTWQRPTPPPPAWQRPPPQPQARFRDRRAGRRYQYHPDPKRCDYCREFGPNARHCGHNQGTSCCPLTAICTYPQICSP